MSTTLATEEPSTVLPPISCRRTSIASTPSRTSMAGPAATAPTAGTVATGTTRPSSGTGAGDDRLSLRRAAVPGGRPGRAAQPPAWHDAAHLPGHPGRLRGQCRHPVRRVRAGVLVGAGPADRDHAAGPLAGDAGPRPGLQRP